MRRWQSDISRQQLPTMMESSRYSRKFLVSFLIARGKPLSSSKMSIEQSSYCAFWGKETPRQRLPPVIIDSAIFYSSKLISELKINNHHITHPLFLHLFNSFAVRKNPFFSLSTKYFWSIFLRKYPVRSNYIGSGSLYPPALSVLINLF